MVRPIEIWQDYNFKIDIYARSQRQARNIQGVSFKDE